jgi:Icc-related predicted phosphoesterase
MKDIAEREITATPVAGNKVQPAIGITTQATTDVHTREETNRDTKITATETHADLIIIIRDLIAQTLITATNATGTTTHHNRGPQYKTITHIVIDQHPPISSQPREILYATIAIRENTSLENAGQIWLVSTTRHVAIR